MDTGIAVSVCSPHPREYARELNTAVTLIRGRAIDTGQLTLIGKRLITVAGGRQKIRVLVKPADYETTTRPPSARSSCRSSEPARSRPQ